MTGGCGVQQSGELPRRGPNLLGWETPGGAFQHGLYDFGFGGAGHPKKDMTSGVDDWERQRDAPGTQPLHVHGGHGPLAFFKRRRAGEE